MFIHIDVVAADDIETQVGFGSHVLNLFGRDYFIIFAQVEIQVVVASGKVNYVKKKNYDDYPCEDVPVASVLACVDIENKEISSYQNCEAQQHDS